VDRSRPTTFFFSDSAGNRTQASGSVAKKSNYITAKKNPPSPESASELYQPGQPPHVGKVSADFHLCTLNKYKATALIIHICEQPNGQLQSQHEYKDIYKETHKTKLKQFN
jgi:hypothetical protein